MQTTTNKIKNFKLDESKFSKKFLNALHFTRKKHAETIRKLGEL